jgi:hypothetical protein
MKGRTPHRDQTGSAEAKCPKQCSNMLSREVSFALQDQHWMSAAQHLRIVPPEHSASVNCTVMYRSDGDLPRPVIRCHQA